MTHADGQTGNVIDFTPRMCLAGNWVLLSHDSDCCHRISESHVSCTPAEEIAGSDPSFVYEGRFYASAGTSKHASCDIFSMAKGCFKSTCGPAAMSSFLRSKALL